MKRKHIIAIMSIAVIVLFGIGVLYMMNTASESLVLNGTYSCAEPPFASMVFDEKDAYSFYLFNFFDATDTGRYAKKEDNVYTVNSANLNNVDITLKKNWFSGEISFAIDLGGNEYVFVKISDIPTIIET